MGRYAEPLAAAFCDSPGSAPAIRCSTSAAGNGCADGPTHDRSAARRHSDRSFAALHRRDPEAFSKRRGASRYSGRITLQHSDIRHSCRAVGRTFYDGPPNRPQPDGARDSPWRCDSRMRVGRLNWRSGARFGTRVRMIDRDAQGEAFLSGASEGHLTELLEGAGLRDVTEDSIAVSVVHPTFEGVVGTIHIRCRPCWRSRPATRPRCSRASRIGGSRTSGQWAVHRHGYRVGRSWQFTLSLVSGRSSASALRCGARPKRE